MFWDVEANIRLAAHECELDELEGSLNKNSQNFLSVVKLGRIFRVRKSRLEKSINKFRILGGGFTKGSLHGK